jgi:molecular chaperone GrpE (heat shock protein)
LPGVKALIDGVKLTERELLKALERSGVCQFTPRGEKFDPNEHQAPQRVLVSFRLPACRRENFRCCFASP